MTAPKSLPTGAPKAAGSRLVDTPPAATVAELAAALGLIGAFRSEEGDLAANHSERVKERLRTGRMRDAMPVVPRPKRARRLSPRR